MFRSLFLLATFIFCLSASCQIKEKSLFGGLIYKTSGLGIAFQNKLDAPNGKGKQLDLELVSFHHLQETKTFNKEVNNPTPFVFGKLNKAAIFKINYSFTYNLSDFSDAQRIGIDFVYGGGVAVGILKPVYINIIYPDASGYETVLAEKYDPLSHTDKSLIAGYSDMRIGWNELNYKTGLTINGGIGFTWGYFTNFPKRLETGFYIDYFKKGLPIMAFAKNNEINEGVYIKLFLGKSTSKN